MHVAPGLVVTLEFTLQRDDGHLLDWTEPGRPLAYLHGTGRLLPGLERALDGLEAGATLAVEIPPDEAYGWRDESLVQTVPRLRLESDAPLQLGMTFEARTPSGRVRFATVVAFEGDEVVLDMNHPLAGRTLRAEARVLGVRAPTAAESVSGRPLSGLDPTGAPPEDRPR